MLLTRIARVPLCLQIGNNLIADIGEILHSYNLKFDRYVLITTEHLWNKYGRVMKLPIRDKIFITTSDIETVSKLELELRNISRNALVLAFGGGKVIDPTKLAVTKTGHSYLSIPTTLSNDGIYSPIAVITQKGRKVRFGSNIPLGVIVDLEIVSKAPPGTIASGVGDLISNISALADWKLADKAGAEKIDGFSFALSDMAAHYFLSSDLIDIGDPEFLKRLAYGLIMSGLSMELAGSSRPCSGSEHMFSHAIDYLYPAQARPHGIQVAFGTLIMERLRGHDISRLVSFYRKVGLPTNLEEFGLPREMVVQALLYAPKTRTRYTIFSELTLDKGKVEDAINGF